MFQRQNVSFFRSLKKHSCRRIIAKTFERKNTNLGFLEVSGTRTRSTVGEQWINDESPWNWRPQTFIVVTRDYHGTVPQRVVRDLESSYLSLNIHLQRYPWWTRGMMHVWGFGEWWSNSEWPSSLKSARGAASPRNHHSFLPFWNSLPSKHVDTYHSFFLDCHWKSFFDSFETHWYALEYSLANLNVIDSIWTYLGLF